MKRLSLSTIFLSLFLTGAAAVALRSMTRINEYAGRIELIGLYILLPSMTAVLLFCALRASREVRSYAAYLGFLTVALLYAAEVMLAVHARFPTGLVAMLGGERFDWRTPISVALDLRATGADAHPDLYPAYVRTLPESERAGLLPLGGISRATSIDGNESGSYVVYSTDEHGFRNPRGLYSAGAVDLLLAGDSFIHGSCVQPGQELAARLRERGFRPLSLGMGGNGPLTALGTIREFGSVLRPRTVLWSYFEGNDLQNLREERTNGILSQYNDPKFSQNLFTRQSEVDALLRGLTTDTRLRSVAAEERNRTINKALKLFHLRTLLGLRSEPEQDDRPPSEEELAMLKSIWSLAKEEVANWGGSLYVLYIPEYRRYADPESAVPERERVLSTLAELGIEVLDFHRVLAEHEDPLAFYPFRAARTHFNAQGYERLATFVAQRLREEIP